ncbi:MAG TPA: ABC transporter permease, partial [Puia sp.]|nr:ABC transporter permease [Puia sp.]
MIKNYFKTTFRNLWKHRVFSFINLTGLAVGMSACFLIFLYVRFELSYDAFHSKADRIYRVVCDIKTPTETIHANLPSFAMPINIKREFSEVQSFARTINDNLLVRRGNVKFQEENSVWADSSLFNVFDFKLLKGNPVTALKEPLTVVLSQKGAKKYFGNENPIGQTLLLTGDALSAVVTGIMQDIPENSLIKGDLFLSMSTLMQKLEPHLEEQWGNFGATTYLLLKPGISPKTLEKKFPAFLEKRDGTGMKQSQMYYDLFLEPLRNVHLYSTRDGSKTGNINNVYIFSIVAVFILVIACINFINLTTAR